MNDNPFAVFAEWYEEAGTDPATRRDVIALATATPEGRPSVRMVFYRGMREGGFSFFTNYESRKGHELEKNPFASIVFYWAHMGRQVRLEGEVQRLSAAESDLYFEGRSYQSQMTAALSRQSQSIPDEAQFLEDLERTDMQMLCHRIPRPANWGGFKLIPSLFEFWTRGEHRRHQRKVYEQKADVWKESRLYP